jgi:hypothetical protein
MRGNDPPTFSTLTPTLSPQGRGRLWKWFARGSARNDYFFYLFTQTLRHFFSLKHFLFFA